MYNSYSMFDETLTPYREKAKKELMQQFVNLIAERRDKLVALNETNNGVCVRSDDDSNSNV